VLDDLALVDPTDPTGGARAPWDSGLFEGVIDFPELQVAPGSRRGFVPDDAALEFLLALERLDAELARRVAMEAEQRSAQRRENLAREIRRAFASVARRLPQYDLFDVRSAEAHAAMRASKDGSEPSENNGLDAVDPTRSASIEPYDVGAAGDAGAAGATSDAEGAGPGSELEAPYPPAGHVAESTETADEASLFPPGPLCTVRIVPARARIAPLSERRFRAIGMDADGRRVEREPSFAWSLDGPGRLAAKDSEAVYVAPDSACDARLSVRARADSIEASATAKLEIRETIASTSASGIPDPEPVNAPSESWRSRMRAARWEFNEGHPDFIAVRDDDARRLRYLCHLFAKEIVLRNFGDPAHGELLERMVEVLTHLGDGRAR
jgi:hypothetical protein